MAIIGTAYVQVRGITDKLRGDIDSGLAGSTVSAQKAGEKIGSDLVTGIKNKTSGVKVGQDVDFSGVADKAEHAVDGVGRDMASKLDSEFQDGIGDIERTAEDVGDGAGRGLGNRFAAGVSGSGAGGALGGLAVKILALGPVIAVAVSALSSLVSGLFAIGSAVAPAVSSLAVLPGILAAIAQGAIAGVVAFGGIGAALKAGTKAAQGIGSAGGSAVNTAKQQERAAQQVKSAQEALAQAYKDSADRQINATESVAKAYRDLSRAQQEAKDAQLAVNKAREDAIEQLKQLGFNVEEASIQEKEAAIALQKAQENYARFLDLPPDNRLRQEALLTLQNADLNYREAVDKNQQLQKAQTEAAQKGVEGSDTVVKAKRNEVDAEQSLADARQNVNDALRQQIRAQEQSTKQINDAKQALKNAKEDLKGVGAAGGGAAGGIDRFAQAMKNLSPEQRKFVLALLDFKKAFKSVRDEAGKDLFPLLTRSIKTITGSGILKDLGEGLRESGKQIGLFGLGIANLTKDPFFRGTFRATLQSNNVVLSNIRQALVPLVAAFFALTAAAAPVTEEFAKFIKLKSQAMAAYTGVGLGATGAAKAQEHLRAVITDGAEVFKQIVRIFSNIGSALFNIGKSSRESGQGLLDSLEGVTKRFKDFAKAPENVPQFKKFFADVATNVRAISNLLRDLTVDFVKLGDEPGVKKVADTLRTTVLPALNEIFINFTNKYGPQLADTFSSVVDAFKGFADSPAFKVALGIIKAFADTLTFIVQTPGLRQIAFTVITAVTAIKTIQKIGDFVGLKKLVGYFDKIQAFKDKRALKGIADDAQGAADAANGVNLGGGPGTPGGGGGAGAATTTVVPKVKGAEDAAKDLGKVEKAAGGLKGTLAGLGVPLALLSAPILIIGAAVAALGLVLFGAYKNSAKFRDAVKSIGDKLKPVIAAVREFGEKALKAVGDFIADVIIPAIGTFVKNILPGLKDGFASLGGAFAQVGTAIAPLLPHLRNFAVIFIKDILPVIGKVIGFIFKLVAAIDGALLKTIIAIITAIIKFDIILVKTFIGIGKAVFDFGNLVNRVIGAVVGFFVGLPGQIAGAVSNLFGPITAAAGAVASFIAGRIDNIVANFTGLGRRISRAVSGVFNALRTAILAIRAYVGARVDDIIGFFTRIGGRVTKAVSGAFGGIGTGIRAARDYVGARLTDVVNLFSGIRSRITKAASGMWDGITSAFKSAINAIIRAWNNLSFTIPGVDTHIPGVGKIGGFTLGTPNIPLLAKGGTVGASNGGTLALLAEAGKPENVTPLGPNGRSKGEDDILQALLSGAAKSVTVQTTVNPSQKTDEELLASHISRKVAWKIRTT